MRLQTLQVPPFGDLSHLLTNEIRALCGSSGTDIADPLQLQVRCSEQNRRKAVTQSHGATAADAAMLAFFFQAPPDAEDMKTMTAAQSKTAERR